MNNILPESAGYQKKVHEAWLHFIADDPYDYSEIRPEILQSWRRSRSSGVNPTESIYYNLGENELNLRVDQKNELISIVHPYIDNLYNIVSGSGSYILLSDQDGYIIDYRGDPDIIKKGVNTNLGLGAGRAENEFGTNGIGTALHLKKPVQIWGEEHFCEKQKGYTCSGAPFFDHEGNLEGCINVTMSIEDAHPHTLGMVVCAADSITKELKLRHTMRNLEVVNAQRNSIIENISTGIILLNSLGRVTQVNQYALQMLQLSYSDLIGRDLFDYIMIEGYDAYSAQEFLRQEKDNEEVSIFLKYAPKSPRRYNLSINHVSDASGRINETIVRMNKPEVLNRLANTISGFRARYTFDSIYHTSSVMHTMIEQCKKAARSESNVLIIGESGTGKELIAQSIHNASDVSSGPFVAINCAAIPNSLVESELFGYEKGAFTGAEKTGHPGKFEMADGGTIFLDEIGDMPYDVQSTLLRVIQTKEVIRIGGKFPKQIDIRIIAATNQDLEKAVEEKTFREDLFYRLDVFTIDVPPLRERGPEDITLLANHFLEEYNYNHGTEISISDEALLILNSYQWPGNVRQLENVVERAINLCSDNMIMAADLPKSLSHAHQAAAAKPSPTPIPLTSIPPRAVPSAEAISAATPAVTPAGQEVLSVHRNEKDLIIAALTQCSGNVTSAARALEMNLRTLYRKLKRYEIDVQKYRT